MTEAMLNSGAAGTRFVALRSALYNLLSWLTVIVLVPPLSLLVAPFPLPFRYFVLSRWAQAQVWFMRTICRLDYAVEGLENIPSGAAIVFCKHQSAWETIALQDFLPRQTWVLKRELLWIPFFGWGLALLRPIAIDRSAGRRAVQQVIEQGLDRLKGGSWVIVFPEGTRVPVGQQRRFGIGGAALAVGTGYPVVPIAHNAGTFWPRRGFRKRPGTVRVIIGKPIDPKGKSAEEINRIAAQWMTAAMTKLEGAAPTTVGADSRK